MVIMVLMLLVLILVVKSLFLVRGAALR